MCGVGFVRENNFPLGIVISHEGMVIDGLWLVDADSVSKRVEKRKFLAYVRQNSDYFDGAIFYEFH